MIQNGNLAVCHHFGNRVKCETAANLESNDFEDYKLVIEIR